MTRARTSIATWAFLVVACASVLVPFAIIAMTSLQPADSLRVELAWPSDPQWGNYAEAFQTAGFGALLRNSAVIALVVVPLTLICASLGGFAFAVLDFPGKGLLFAFFLVGMTLPYEAIVIPLYFAFRGSGLLDTLWAVILPLTGAFLPFGIFWMRSYVQSLPTEMLEAATIDGAGLLRTLRSIVLPNSGPAVTTLALLTFMWAWNHFLLALILIRDASLRTAPSGLGVFVQQYGENIPLLCAGTIIIITPIVVLYLVFQRRFISGIVQGAVR